MESQLDLSARKAAYWSIWKTIDRLDAVSTKPRHEHECLAPSIVRILSLWANWWAGDPLWQSLLNKTSFEHEVEESMVALYYLKQWRTQTECTRFIAVDVAGGKGIFSMLLQYVAALEWKNEDGAILERIILIEKATDAKINWNHLSAAPQEAVELPRVEIWQDCDLFLHEELVNRLERLQWPLALSGIHLCKLLSPALISVCNLLGERCPYLCLAPCCMPRAVRSKRMETQKRQIQVLVYESTEQQQERQAHAQQREASRRKDRSDGCCFLCQSTNHWLRQCPRFPSDPAAQSILLREASAATPCWHCGLVGHFAARCTQPRITAECVEPPSVTLDLGNILDAPDPLSTYCQLLASSVQQNGKVMVVETGLQSYANHQSATSWNSFRKDLFIIAAGT